MNESELRMRVGIFINGKWKVVLKPLVVVTTGLVLITRDISDEGIQLNDNF